MKVNGWGHKVEATAEPARSRNLGSKETDAEVPTGVGTSVRMISCREVSGLHAGVRGGEVETGISRLAGPDKVEEVCPVGRSVLRACLEPPASSSQM